jgi:hypothetical protein
MSVTLVPHEVVKPLIAAWRRTLSPDRDERQQLARERWKEFVRRIVEAEGPPPGSVEDVSTNPTSFWCNWPGGGLAQIVVMPDRRTGFFTVERKVVLINLNFSPGPGR